MSFDCVLAAWQAHEREVRGFLLHRLADPHTADDLLQEVFLKSMRQGEHFCAIENPRAWLFQVARNALVDRARLQRPLVELPEQLAAPQEERAPVDALDACLRRNLSEMSDEDRDIIEQCDLRGVRQHAYAQAAGLSLPAAKARLLRARKRLREALTRNCQVRFDETGRVCCHVPRESPARDS